MVSIDSSVVLENSESSLVSCQGFSRSNPYKGRVYAEMAPGCETLLK